MRCFLQQPLPGAQLGSFDAAISILLLGVSAAAASVLPASRAASSNPMKALRTD